MNKSAILSLSLLAGTAHAVDATRLADCAAVADDSKRLACYDALAGHAAVTELGTDPTLLVESPVTPGSDDTTVDDETEFVSPRLYQEEANANNRFVIIPHKRNYLLPVTYNNHPNKAGWEDMFPDTRMDKVEAKFQVSFKAILWEDMFDKGIDLWGAYTQENWMQTYNTEASSPFRETDYQPELILSIDNDFKLLGFHNTRLDFSFNHQSNGRSRPLSRSWNRAIASALFERKNFSLKTSAWYRLPENNKDDDNPHIEQYMGKAELQGVWKWPNSSLGFSLRNNLDSDNKGSIQLDWTFPLSRRFQGYVQYFNGYGESLIDYDVSTNRIGIGVSLTDPL